MGGRPVAPAQPARDACVRVTQVSGSSIHGACSANGTITSSAFGSRGAKARPTVAPPLGSSSPQRNVWAGSFDSSSSVRSRSLFWPRHIYVPSSQKRLSVPVESSPRSSSVLGLWLSACQGDRSAGDWQEPPLSTSFPGAAGNGSTIKTAFPPWTCRTFYSKSSSSVEPPTKAPIRLGFGRAPWLSTRFREGPQRLPWGIPDRTDQRPI